MAAITFARSQAGKKKSWIYVVDDNDDDRRAVAQIFSGAAVNIRVFEDGECFLAVLGNLEPGCVVLDVRMPGVDGLSVVDLLTRQRADWPVVMMSNQTSIPLVVRAMQRGARHFVEKPCDPQRLKEAVTQACNNEYAPKLAPAMPSRPLHKIITPREMDVLRLLLKGQQNKSIAYALGISERTVEVHRARLMRRLEVRSFAELIRKAVEYGVSEQAEYAPHA